MARKSTPPEPEKIVDEAADGELVHSSEEEARAVRISARCVGLLMTDNETADYMLQRGVHPELIPGAISFSREMQARAFDETDLQAMKSTAVAMSSRLAQSAAKTRVRTTRRIRQLQEPIAEVGDALRDAARALRGLSHEALDEQTARVSALAMTYQRLVSTEQRVTASQVAACAAEERVITRMAQLFIPKSVARGSKPITPEEADGATSKALRGG